MTLRKLFFCVGPHPDTKPHANRARPHPGPPQWEGACGRTRGNDDMGDYGMDENDGMDGEETCGICGSDSDFEVCTNFND